MTGAAADDDHHPAFDVIKDRLQKAGTMPTVRAWRSSDVHLRERLSSLAVVVRGQRRGRQGPPLTWALALALAQHLILMEPGPTAG